MFSPLKSYLSTLDNAALLVTRRPDIFSHYGNDTRRYPCYSMRKSFLSTLFGYALAESRFDWSLTLEQLGINDRQRLSELERQATLYDLLMASSGICNSANYEIPWMRSIKHPRHRYAHR